MMYCRLLSSIILYIAVVIATGEIQSRSYPKKHIRVLGHGVYSNLRRIQSNETGEVNSSLDKQSSEEMSQLQSPEIPSETSSSTGTKSYYFIFIISAAFGALSVGLLVGCFIVINRISKKEVPTIKDHDIDIDSVEEKEEESFTGLSVEESIGRSSAYFNDTSRLTATLSPSFHDTSMRVPGCTLNIYDDSFTKALPVHDPRRLEMIVGISQKVAGGQSVGSNSQSKNSKY